MAPFACPSCAWDPEVNEILERAARLTSDQLVTLARAYPPPGAQDSDVIDRRRVLSIARARAGRPAEMRAIEAAVARALAGIGPYAALQTLRRLGILETAERAVTDAVMAVALRDRLGVPEVEELSRPWASLE